MFVDELTIKASAGHGGDGVVRWRRMKFKPKAGPAGGNGGNGGDVYIRAVRDLNVLSRYTGKKEFKAGGGNPGSSSSMHGKNGEDCVIDLPVGSVVTDTEKNRIYHLTTLDEVHKILHGGAGGLGNEYFKSSTNRAPENNTEGKKGETSTFSIEISLRVSAGLVGLPNAGKSTLLNTLTRAQSRVGEYPFTTLEPHLGNLNGHTLADIPGLIEGAAEGRGLGHKFLKHITKTGMILHCVAADIEDVLGTYELIRSELTKYDKELLKKDEWIVLTKTDLVSTEECAEKAALLESTGMNVYPVSALTKNGIDALSSALRTEFANFATVL